MREHIDGYWRVKLDRVKKALEKNNFEVHIVDTIQEAGDLALNTILPASGARSVAFGGSMTIQHSGIYEALKKRQDISVIDTYDTSVPREEYIERRRQALLCDLFLMSANGVTEDGTLVNLDGTGNRVAALCFGPRHVVVVAGRNKITPGVESAMEHIKAYTAPTNAIRLGRKTPCTKTGSCEDCSSPDRICNVWTITEKSAPAGRIKIILVNQDFGF